MPEGLTGDTYILTRDRSHARMDSLGPNDVIVTEAGTCAEIDYVKAITARTHCFHGPGHHGVQSGPDHGWWILHVKNGKAQSTPSFVPGRHVKRGTARWGTPTVFPKLPFDPPPGWPPRNGDVWKAIGAWLAGGKPPIDHKPMREWLHSNFGKRQHRRAIPTWAMGMDPKHRTALLAGYREYQRKNGKAKTASHSLALGLASLEHSLGRLVHVERAGYVGIRPAWRARPLSDRERRGSIKTRRHAWTPANGGKPFAGIMSAKLYQLRVKGRHNSYIANGRVVAGGPPEPKPNPSGGGAPGGVGAGGSNGRPGGSGGGVGIGSTNGATTGDREPARVGDVAPVDDAVGRRPVVPADGGAAAVEEPAQVGRREALLDLAAQRIEAVRQAVEAARVAAVVPEAVPATVGAAVAVPAGQAARIADTASARGLYEARVAELATAPAPLALGEAAAFQPARLVQAEAAVRAARLPEAPVPVGLPAGARWEDATSLADVGELTARWLRPEERGTLTHPNGHPNPDVETEQIAAALARVNRRGFVTLGSQPGVANGVGSTGAIYHQQAAVEGFAIDKATADRIQRLAEAEGLTVIRNGPAGSRRDYSTAVGEPGFGTHLSRADVDHVLGRKLSPELADELQGAEQVAIVDTAGWSNDRLIAFAEAFDRPAPTPAEAPAALGPGEVDVRTLHPGGASPRGLDAPHIAGYLPEGQQPLLISDILAHQAAPRDLAELRTPGADHVPQPLLALPIEPERPPISGPADAPALEPDRRRDSWDAGPDRVLPSPRPLVGELIGVPDPVPVWSSPSPVMRLEAATAAFDSMVDTRAAVLAAALERYPNADHTELRESFLGDVERTWTRDHGIHGEPMPALSHDVLARHGVEDIVIPPSGPREIIDLGRADASEPFRQREVSLQEWSQLPESLRRGAVLRAIGDPEIPAHTPEQHAADYLLSALPATDRTAAIREIEEPLFDQRLAEQDAMGTDPRLVETPGECATRKAREAHLLHSAMHDEEAPAHMAELRDGRLHFLDPAEVPDPRPPIIIEPPTSPANEAAMARWEALPAAAEEREAPTPAMVDGFAAARRSVDAAPPDPEPAEAALDRRYAAVEAARASLREAMGAVQRGSLREAVIHAREAVASARTLTAAPPVIPGTETPTARPTESRISDVRDVSEPFRVEDAPARGVHDLTAVEGPQASPDLGLGLVQEPVERLGRTDAAIVDGFATSPVVPELNGVVAAQGGHGWHPTTPIGDIADPPMHRAPEAAELATGEAPVPPMVGPRDDVAPQPEWWDGIDTPGGARQTPEVSEPATGGADGNVIPLPMDPDPDPVYRDAADFAAALERGDADAALDIADRQPDPDRFGEVLYDMHGLDIDPNQMRDRLEGGDLPSPGDAPHGPTDPDDPEKVVMFPPVADHPERPGPAAEDSAGLVHSPEPSRDPGSPASEEPRQPTLDPEPRAPAPVIAAPAPDLEPSGTGPDTPDTPSDRHNGPQPTDEPPEPEPVKEDRPVEPAVEEPTAPEEPTHTDSPANDGPHDDAGHDDGPSLHGPGDDD